MRLAPASTESAFFPGIAALPAFNPDDEVEPPVPAVAAWRNALAHADGILLSSPEYAHGVPGALKNALDWVVGSNELYQKPIALLNPSPESEFAHPQLAETLRTMGADVVPGASLTIRIPRRGAALHDILTDDTIAPEIRQALIALHAAIATRANTRSMSAG